MMPSSPVSYIDAQPTNWRKEVIDDLAERIADQLHFQPGDNIRDLITRLGGTVEFQDPIEWLETDSGSIEVRGERDFTVFVSNFTSLARDRFTMAHELGHFVLHSRCGKIPIRVPRSGSNRLEWEANWFAAGFLMPTKSFRAAWRETPNGAVMAAKFKVSIKAAEVRKDSLGLTEKG